MANKALYIFEPLLRGVLLGLVGGAAAVLLFRAGTFVFKDASYGLSDNQEKIAFWGFTIWFGLFGLIDSTNRFIFWIRSRNQQK